jgi:CheY-like chemotaxis protein
MNLRESPYLLVVDDEPGICEFLDRVLGMAGYRVRTTTSPIDALRSVTETGAPDLLLTDLKMPMMEGDVLAARLRQSDPDLPVLYLTGFADHLFRERPVLWEREAFLEKPCSPDGVLEAVSMLLYGHLVPHSVDPGIMWFSSLRHGLLTLNVTGRRR